MIAEGMVARLSWQPVVFAERPRRADLARLKAAWPLTSLAVRIHRNHTVEFATGPLKTFLAYAGWDAAITVGDYDDSVTAAPAERAADMELVWLDHDRYRERQAPSDLAAWLSSRVEAIRGTTRAPIVITDAPGDDAWATELRVALARTLDGMPGVALAPVSAVAATLGPDFRDARASAITASSLSDEGSIAVARLLGFVALPPLLAPRIKALALDLDNTLYAGVLGEDGPMGITITAAHAALHGAIRDLAASGVLVTLVSRNEPADVEALFAARPDLALPWAGFSARAIGWGRKSAGIEAVAAQLNISEDAVLFIDDNPGELAEVAGALPSTRSLLAADPAEVTRALGLYPALVGYRAGAADAVRAGDLAASAARQAALAADTDPGAYARELGARLDLRMDPQDLVGRLAELSGKTNQFNTGLRRLSELDVARRLADPDERMVSIALSDRLSDSGVVGAIACRRDGATVVVDEIAISCRALGRGVETIAILTGILRAANELGATTIRIPFTDGPRNGPARTWLDLLPAGVTTDGVGRTALEQHAEQNRNGLEPRWEGE